MVARAAFSYQTSCNELNSKLIEGWKSYELTPLRVRFAGSGGSIFSILNSTYRQSLNELKGLCKQEFPPPIPIVAAFAEDQVNDHDKFISDFKDVIRYLSRGGQIQNGKLV
jgi:hypothetical protein